MGQYNLTVDGTTNIDTLTPQAMHTVAVEGTFDGATVIVKTPGGVKYLPFRDGEASITEPDAAEFRALGNKADIVVATAGAGTNLTVTIDEFQPRS